VKSWKLAQTASRAWVGDVDLWEINEEIDSKVRTIVVPPYILAENTGSGK
jgi:hypothetical protein